jgi:hypothetical protein
MRGMLVGICGRRRRSSGVRPEKVIIKTTSFWRTVSSCNCDVQLASCTHRLDKAQVTVEGISRG